jgi:hypothetical protein
MLVITDHDIKEIKDKLIEIIRLLKNAGFVNSSPARVYEITEEAKRKSDKIKERLYGNSSDR